MTSLELDAASTRQLFEDIWSIMDQHDAVRAECEADDWRQRDLLVSDLYKSLTPRKRMSCANTPYRAASKRVWRFRGNHGIPARVCFENWLEENDFEVYNDPSTRQNVMRVKTMPEE